MKWWERTIYWLIDILERHYFLSFMEGMLVFIWLWFGGASIFVALAGWLGMFYLGRRLERIERTLNGGTNGNESGGKQIGYGRDDRKMMGFRREE